MRGDWRKEVSYRTEKPLLGFDDFMGFVAATRAGGALVTVNCTRWPASPELSGTAHEAAAWVAYANTPIDDAPVPIS